MPVSVTFLDHVEACAWVREHHTPYLDRVLACPHNAKQRTYSDTDRFCEHLVDWTPEEKRELYKRIQRLVARCWSWRPMLGGEWTFIQGNDTLEDGMPHTIHTAIVLPRWMVRTLLFETADPVTKQTAYETLLHERIHVLQKAHPNRFRALYAAWGWRPIANGGGADRAIDGLERQRPTRANPDTLIRWGCVRTGADGVQSTWVPHVHMRDGMRDVVYYLVSLDQKNNQVQATWHEQRRVDWYTTYFGGSDHCYHPDESAAVLLAERMVRDARGEAPHRCPAVDAAVTWAAGWEG